MESVKPTWKLRLALLILVMLGAFVTRDFWSMRIGQSLVCTEQLSQGDLILVENIDPYYMLFERAATLQKAGFAARVLIPVQISHESERASAIAIGVAELMGPVSQIQMSEVMPIRVREPISLNAAYEIRDFLTKRASQERYCCDIRLSQQALVSHLPGGDGSCWDHGVLHTGFRRGGA